MYIAQFALIPLSLLPREKGCKSVIKPLSLMERGWGEGLATTYTKVSGSQGARLRT
jgi:hypothetical protein